jgi:hypothetical protein
MGKNSETENKKNKKKKTDKRTQGETASEFIKMLKDNVDKSDRITGRIHSLHSLEYGRSSRV